MRIFLAVDHEPMPGNRLWFNNLHLPLCDLGHDLVSFSFDLTPYFLNVDPNTWGHAEFFRRQRPQLEQALLEQVAEAHRRKPIDLLFTYFYSSFCRPALIRQIGAMGIKTVNWYCNGSYQFDLVRELAPAYDYCLVPEAFRLADYRRIGANPIYCQEAANPAIYHPYDLRCEYDVTFIGGRYGDRPEFIHALLAAGMDVRVWGRGWRQPGNAGQRTTGARRGGAPALPHRILAGLRWRGRAVAERLRPRRIAPAVPPDVGSKTLIPAACCGDPLSDEDLVKTYSRSRINLGFSSCGETHRDGARILQVRLRDFEVPMSGGFYMVEYMPELAEFFDIDREIVCYRDKAELVEKAKYYLAHEQERETIRLAGLARCRRDHTWQKRLTACFAAMGVGP